MAPVSKNTLEVASPAAGNSVSQTSAPASSSSSPSRSEVVSLELPVKVHGSRVKEVVGGVTPSTEPFEEQSQTMIVFPDGGVVKLSTAVNAGQMLVLTNLKTRQDAICRVLKVRPNPNGSNYVEVEFTHRQPGYWGISFPSDAGTEQKKVELPPAPVDTKPQEETASDISWAPAPTAPNAAPSSSPQITPPPPALKPVAPAATSNLSAPPVPKPEPTFISIGMQEEVQPAAAATAAISPRRLSESEIEKLVAPAAKSEPAIELPPAATAAEPVEVSISELQGDAKTETPALFSVAGTAPAETEPALALPQAAAASSGRIFGRFAGSTALGSTSNAEAEDAGAELEMSGALGSSKLPGTGQNWTLIAAGAAVLLAGLAGGVYYVRSHANASLSEMRVASAARPVAPVGAQNQGFDAAVQPGAPVRAASDAPAKSPAMVSGATAVTVPAKGGVSSSGAQPQPAEAAPAIPPKAVAPSVTSDMMTGALSAHPTAPARMGEDAPDEPSVTSHPGYAEANGYMHADLPSSSNAASLPVPTVQPEGPVKVGGQVQEPKLISSVLPIYPMAAKNSGIQGDVVIETTIDKDGNVTGLRVISGPAVLRQSASDALRKWKYEPSKLDGQPISVQMMVTIRFRK